MTDRAAGSFEQSMQSITDTFNKCGIEHDSLDHQESIQRGAEQDVEGDTPRPHQHLLFPVGMT